MGVMVEHLWDLLSGGHPVLDLGSMTFCDSVGLSRLIAVFETGTGMTAPASGARPCATYQGDSMSPAATLAAFLR